MAERITGGGLSDRPDPETLDRVPRAKTADECFQRSAEALAYAEEKFLLGAPSKAAVAISLSREYRALGKVMAETNGAD